MTDPFTDVADELMTRATDLGGTEPSSPPPAPPAAGAKTKKHVCPYCGAVTAVVEKPTGPCPRCNMEDTPAARAATKARIGPWYVLQTRNPSAPGMKWATLLSLVSKGQVTPRSVVRGPTTHQLWKFAAHVKGLSREFNLCYSCGAEIDRTANQCAQCDRLQEPPFNPDALLESREIAPRMPIQRELKPVSGEATEMVLANTDERNRQRTPDDGILSAKELATAFQLDFNPATRVDPPEREPREPHPVRNFMLVMLLLAAGGAAFLYAKPDYRMKASAWLHDTYASARTSMTPAPKPVVVNPPPWATKPGESQTEPTPASAEIKPVPAPETAPIPAPAPTRSEAVVEKTDPPAPVPTPEPTPPVAEAVAPAPSPQPEPAPAVVEKPQASPQLAEQTAQQADDLIKIPIPSDLNSQIELGSKLKNAGIDADRMQDFKLSLRCYRRIKELSPGAQPTDIDFRLKYALDNAPK